MRAFVTGGTGFVGGRLVPRLLAEGHAVTVLARDPGAAAAAARAGARVVPGDITQPEGLPDLLAGHDCVFHLAAWYRFGIRDAALMEAINLGGTENLLAAAKEAGVPRFVHCSTMGVYGADRGEERDEGWYDAPSVQAMHYTRTKRLAHLAARRAAEEGLHTVLVSPSAIFGPGDRSIVGRLLSFVVRGWMKVCFYRDTVMGFVHVDDVVQGLLRASERGEAGRDYILNTRSMTLGAIIDRAAATAGRRPPLFWLPNWMIRASRPLSPLVAPVLGQGPRVLRESVAMMDGVSLRYRSDRARQELGWQPGDFEQQLEATVAAAVAAG